MSKSNSILAWFAAMALMELGKAAIAGPDNPGENHEGGDVKDGEGALGRPWKYALFKSHK